MCLLFCIDYKMARVMKSMKAFSIYFLSSCIYCRLQIPSDLKLNPMFIADFILLL